MSADVAYRILAAPAPNNRVGARTIAELMAAAAIEQLGDPDPGREVVYPSPRTWATGISVAVANSVPGLSYASREEILDMVATATAMMGAAVRVAETYPACKALRDAVASPADVVGGRLGPSWGKGHPWYREQPETVEEWQVRALRKAVEGLKDV